MRLILIRHGKTAGNLKKQYIGRTDEPLCPSGVKELQQWQYPKAERLIVSSMKRCEETAQIIYEDQHYTLCDALRECDFGRFEGKTYEELKDDEAYAAWLNSGGSLPFPEGESSDSFKERCCCAFEELMKENKQYASVAFVIHGGSIMAVMEKYARPQKSFYDYQVKNGCGFTADYDPIKKEIRNIVELMER